MQKSARGVGVEIRLANGGRYCAEVGMAFVRSFISELLLYVGHVSNDLCLGNSWIGGEIETGLLIHRDGDHGWSPLAQGDGLGRRCSRYVDGISCSYGLLCSGGSLRVYLAQVERKAGSVGHLRALLS